QQSLARAQSVRHPHIPLPRDLYGSERSNSAGVELGDRKSLDALVDEIRLATPRRPEAHPVVDGVARAGTRRSVVSPIDGAAIGSVAEGDRNIVAAAMAAA